MSDASRFFIVTYGRTGSRMLRGMLDSHLAVRCHGEVFGENLSSLTAGRAELLPSLAEERGRDPVKFLQGRVFKPEGRQSVGFKILYRQLFDAWPGLLEALAHDVDVKVIHLLRRDGIRRFMSEQFIRLTGVHELAVGTTRPCVEPMHVHVPALLESLAAVDAGAARVRSVFRSHPFLEMTYEDLVSPDGQMIGRVQEFVGVRPMALSSGVQKVLPEDLHALIANLDEVLDAVRRSPFSDMLAEDHRHE
jgi:hypothetical protein